MRALVLCRRLNLNFVNITPQPIFVRLERLNDGMLRRVKMRRRVLILRRIAATDMTAGLAKSQMHPLVAHLEALFATLR